VDDDDAAANQHSDTQEEMLQLLMDVLDDDATTIVDDDATTVAGDPDDYAETVRDYSDRSDCAGTVIDCSDVTDIEVSREETTADVEVAPDLVTQCQTGASIVGHTAADLQAPPCPKVLLDTSATEGGDNNNANGACMPTSTGSRSRSPGVGASGRRREANVSHNWACMSALEQQERAEHRAVRRSAFSQNNYVPKFAQRAVQHLPPEIKPRFPCANPHDMDIEYLMRHCKLQIAQIKGNHPRRWYIGVCSTPQWRFSD